MGKEIIDWLLEGPIWLKYSVELQLLDSNPDAQAVLQDDSIKQLVNRLKNNKTGIPALKTRKIPFDATGKAFWDLFFLADIGLTVEDLGVGEEIEEFLGLQLPDGTFKITDVDEPNYFCVSAIFLSSLAKIGYKNDPRLRKYLRHILDTQRPDGGWHCGQNHLTGERIQFAESCPMDNLNILMLVGQYEEYRKDPKFNGACDLLLDHWTRKEEKWRPSDFGIGKRFMSLEYPSVKYGILRVLDVLSMFPHAASSKNFRSMLDFVHQKSPDGKYWAESVHEAYGEFEFGQTERPSRWLTFLIGRIEKAVSNHK